MATKKKTTAPKSKTSTSKAKTPKPSTATADLGVEKVMAPTTSEAKATADAPKPDDTLPPKEAATEQFPSLVGQPDVENAERSNDQAAPEADEFRKEFVLIKADYVGGDKSAIHENNEGAVRQFLINQGLRPLGPIKHSSKDHPDGVSIILTYKASAVPAAITTDFNVAHARVDGQVPGIEDAPVDGEDPGKPGK